MQRPTASPTTLVTESHGVTVLSLPCPGPVMAGLVVLYGQADEPLATRGLTHLVEHLTLSHPSMAEYDANGHVALVETSFHVRGPANGAAGFLNGVARLLADPDTTDIATNLRILRAEAGSKPFSQWGQDMHYRFGARGPGTTGHREFGLYGADEASVRRGARQMVQRAGAVAWMTCPPANDLDLSPLNIARAPAGPARKPLGEAFPASALGATNVCSVSFLLPRTYVARSAATLLAAAARQALRTENGWSYGVNESWEVLDAATAHFMLVADCLPEHVGDVRDALLGVVESFMVSGPTADSIERTLRRMEQSLTDPLLIAGRLAGEAIDHLFGREPGTMLDALLELKVTPPMAFGQAIGAAVNTALVLVPASVALTDDSRFTPIPDCSRDVLTGRTFQRTSRLRTPATDDHFILGVDGLSFVPVARPHCPISVRFLHCSAVIHWQDGARTLFGDDGFRLFVHPDDWSHGDQLTGAIDQGVPADAVVEIPQLSRTAPPAKPARRRGHMTAKQFTVAMVAIVLAIAGEWYTVAHNQNTPAPPPPRTTVQTPATQTLQPGTVPPRWTNGTTIPDQPGVPG